MSTLREHIESIARITKGYSQSYPEEPVYQHAVAALAILDFKPLDSDLPPTEGESYPPPTA